MTSIINLNHSIRVGGCIVSVGGCVLLVLVVLLVLMSELTSNTSFLIDSTKHLRDRITELAETIHALRVTNHPKEKIFGLERQLSLLSARYEREMNELMLICEHEWTSKYDIDNNRYSQCVVCDNQKRL